MNIEADARDEERAEVKKKKQKAINIKSAGTEAVKRETSANRMKRKRKRGKKRNIHRGIFEWRVAVHNSNNRKISFSYLYSLTGSMVFYLVSLSLSLSYYFPQCVFSSLFISPSLICCCSDTVDDVLSMRMFITMMNRTWAILWCGC